MRSFHPRRYCSTYFVLVVLIGMLGAGYSLETANADRADSYSVISEQQKPAFLAYAKRQNIRQSPSTDRVSVGDTLPGFGVTYYALPLRYGHPFYRYAAVEKQIVIVDRFSGVVVQVLD
jgi:hypothetical protein